LENAFPQRLEAGRKNQVYGAAEQAAEKLLVW
jgi:hypothetical protein